MSNEIATVSSTYYFVTNELGQIEQRDMKTGRILATSKLANELDGDSVMRVEKNAWRLNDTLRGKIMQLLLEGMSLTKICRMQGMPPYSVIAQFRAKDPEFDKFIRETKYARAEYFIDEIADMEELDPEESGFRNRLAYRKQRVDELKWLSERTNPKEYGTRHVESSGQQPITMQIITGVPVSDNLRDVPNTVVVSQEEGNAKD